MTLVARQRLGLPGEPWALRPDHTTPDWSRNFKPFPAPGFFFFLHQENILNMLMRFARGSARISYAPGVQRIGKGGI